MVKRRGKSVSITAGRRFETIEAKFLASFRKADPSECWDWLGTINSNGYGRLYFIGTPVRSTNAHRFSHEHFKGPIPQGLVIDHLCRNRRCVNPAHLEAVTDKENFRRGIGAEMSRQARAARTHCGNGHPYAEFEVLLPSGGRFCRACKRAQKSRHIQRRAAARAAEKGDRRA